MNKQFPIDISIPLDFNNEQPNHFNVAKAKASPIAAVNFIGDTRRGGSCNVQQISLIPHCNGTHTECIGHITDERVFINEVLRDVVFPATLVTIPPVLAAESGDNYLPQLSADDRIIQKSQLEKALWNVKADNLTGLIIRTQPNESSKKTMDYVEQPAPFFSMEAMQFITNLPIKHLLVDMPSLDKLYDEGLLSTHHIWWNVPLGTHKLTEKSRRERTVTEMIFVPDEIPDGSYSVAIQIPNWCSDAAPSRVFLLPAT
ncbi:MAG: cyclase family protein [Calditrichae bacterium]|nr:cyclase family protein [Calditrichia bacterium]